jgi:uncharacterized protein (TIGR02996 family)
MPTTRSDLIAAIRESPEDDHLRLVCADWFEEQGDEPSVARAEFIRVQIQRAQLSPNDIRQSELQARELRLLKRHGTTWCGSHFVFKKARFRRGFIEYVHLHLNHYLHHRRQMLELEPVRDVRLTGWHRAPTELIQRLARCPELQYLETLRIHHQGPHHSPRSNLLDLLESPQLSRLRALHCPSVRFNADARRRFERLPILSRIQEISWPSLEPGPEPPGNWFSEDDSHCGQLRSLALPFCSDQDALEPFLAMPFWPQLTAIELVMTGNLNNTLATLGDHLPAGLQRLHLSSAESLVATATANSFFHRLGQVPLKSVEFRSVPIPQEWLRMLLDGKNRWRLRELTLLRCAVTDAHARVIADAPGMRDVWLLDLSLNQEFGAAAATALFSSANLTSVVNLNLSSTSLGPLGALALASASGWGRLRLLSLMDARIDQKTITTLLGSPNLQSLTWIKLGGYHPHNSALSGEIAEALTRLPHLASVNLSVPVGEIDPAVRRLLANTDSIAWPWINSRDDWTITRSRLLFAPDRWPPVEVHAPQSFFWKGRENGEAPV